MISLVLSGLGLLGLGVEGARRLNSARYSEGLEVKPVLDVPNIDAMPETAKAGQVILKNYQASVPNDSVRVIGISDSSTTVLACTADILPTLNGFPSFKSSPFNPPPISLPANNTGSILPATRPIPRPPGPFGMPPAQPLQPASNKSKRTAKSSRFG